MTLRARADVPTDSPARYAKQLVSHLGRRITWTSDGNTHRAVIGSADAQVVAGDAVLSLLVDAPERESLERAQHVLASHLERFGRRNELAVTWSEDPTTR
jgi:hypothetical protein